MTDTKNIFKVIQGNTGLLIVLNKFKAHNRLTIANLKHTLNIFCVKGDFKKTKVNFKELINLLTHFS